MRYACLPIFDNAAFLLRAIFNPRALTLLKQALCPPPPISRNCTGAVPCQQHPLQVTIIMCSNRY